MPLKNFYFEKFLNQNRSFKDCLAELNCKCDDFRCWSEDVNNKLNIDRCFDGFETLRKWVDNHHHSDRCSNWPQDGDGEAVPRRVASRTSWRCSSLFLSVEVSRLRVLPSYSQEHQSVPVSGSAILSLALPLASWVSFSLIFSNYLIFSDGFLQFFNFFFFFRNQHFVLYAESLS